MKKIIERWRGDVLIDNKPVDISKQDLKEGDEIDIVLIPNKEHENV